MKITCSGIIGFIIVCICLLIIFIEIHQPKNLLEKFQTETAFDYLQRMSAETRGKEVDIDFLEKKFNIPTYEDYNKIYQEIKDKISSNNNPLLNQFIVDQYLQDIKVDKLKSDISSLNNLVKTQGEVIDCPNPLQQSDNAIKSIKSLKYGISLNSYQIPDPLIKKLPSEPNKNSLPKGCPSYPTQEPINPENDPIMIYLNQGCLSYSSNGREISEDTRDNYWVELCQKRKPEQIFDIKQIKNKDDYNKIIKNQKLHQTQEDSDKIYPFNVIQPRDNPTQCLTLDKNGLSIENCLPLKRDDQIWNPSQEKRPC